MIYLAATSIAFASCLPSTTTESETRDFDVVGETSMSLEDFKLTQAAQKLTDTNNCSSHLGQNSALLIEAGGSRNQLGDALLKCDSAGNCSQVGYTTTQWGLDAPGTMNIKAEAEMYCTLLGRELGLIAKPTKATIIANSDLRVSKISSLAASLRGESRNLKDVYRVYMVNQHDQSGAKKVVDIFFQDTANGIELVGASTKQEQVNGSSSDTALTALYTEVHFVGDATGLRSQ